MKIKVYTAPWCVFCHAELEWLDKINIEYEEISAEGLDFESIPVTEIGETRIFGFDRPAIKRALKKKGLYGKNR